MIANIAGPGRYFDLTIDEESEEEYWKGLEQRAIACITLKPYVGVGGLTISLKDVRQNDEISILPIGEMYCCLLTNKLYTYQ